MRKTVVTLVGTAILLGLLYTFSSGQGDDKKDNLQFIYPEVSPIQDTVTLQGSVIAAEKEMLYAQGNSRVLEVYVSEGQMVSAGQCLMKLEHTEALYGEQANVAAVLTQLQDAVYAGDLLDAEEILAAINANNALQISDSKVYYLYSKKSSVVMKIAANQGDTVGTLLPCVELFCPDSLQMEASAGEEVIGLLGTDMQCLVSVPAFGISELPGRLTSIAPYARHNTQLTGQTSYETDVTISLESNEQLHPGYRATAKVVVSSRENALLLPYDAIEQDDSGQEYVLKLQGLRLIKQIVQTGSELEDRVEICQGLKAKDVVMLHPDLTWEGALISIASH